MQSENTRQPFFKNQKALNIIAIIVALASIVIFIVSCVLDLYVTSITPTNTPTASRTATLTRTPRPPTLTSTPTVTPTPSLTPTVEFVIPTLQETPLFPLLTPESIKLDLEGKGFVCDPTSQTISALVVWRCSTETDAYLEEIQFGGRTETSIDLIRAHLLQKTNISSELAASFYRMVAEIAYSGLLLPTPTQATPVLLAQTATIESTPQSTPLPSGFEAISQWIDQTLPRMTSADFSETNLFDGIFYRLKGELADSTLEIGIFLVQ